MGFSLVFAGFLRWPDLLSGVGLGYRCLKRIAFVRIGGVIGGLFGWVGGMLGGEFDWGFD